MVEQRRPDQKGERAGQFVREFLLFRDADKPFEEKDWASMRQRLRGVPFSEGEAVARGLFAGILNHPRPAIRQRAGEMVKFLYKEAPLSSSLYLGSLGQVSRKTPPENITDLLGLAPSLLITVDNAVNFFGKLDRFVVYYQDNPAVLEAISLLQQTRKQMVRTLSRETVPHKVSAGIVKDFHEELPELWNTYNMTSTKLAVLYGLPETWVRQEVRSLRSDGLPLKLKPRVPDYISSATRITMIPQLTDRWTVEEISIILNLNLRVVQRHVSLVDQDSSPTSTSPTRAIPEERVDHHADATIDKKSQESTGTIFVSGDAPSAPSTAVKTRETVDPEVARRLGEALPELWNTRKLTIHVIATMYSVSDAYVGKSITRLRKHGIAMEHRTTSPRTLAQKIDQIVALASTLTMEEVAAELGFAPIFVEHHWPRRGK